MAGHLALTQATVVRPHAPQPIRCFALVTQLVEFRPFKSEVVGSSPAGRTNLKEGVLHGF